MQKLYVYPVRLLYPPRCTFCDCIIPISADDLICSYCEEDYPLIQEPICKKCGRPMPTEESLCEDCKVTQHSYEKGIALYPYKGIIRESLYRFKYNGRKKYARFFAHMMIWQLQSTDFLKQIDLIIPVPISKERKLQRGYNQSEEIAKFVSKYSNIPYNGSMLRRTKHTSPQSAFSPAERRQNIKGAFKCMCRLEHKVILIVDDIYTTGSTMNECAKVLRNAGARAVYSAVVCIGN